MQAGSSNAPRSMPASSILREPPAMLSAIRYLLKRVCVNGAQVSCEAFKMGGVVFAVRAMRVWT